MKSVLVLLALVCLVAAGTSYNLDLPTGELYKQWLHDHPQFYRLHNGNKESFSIFEDNVAKIKLLNVRNKGKATFDLNQFALLSAEEFARQYLNSVSFGGKNLFDTAEEVPKEALKDLPTSFDWRKATPAVVSTVKDQGACGSCWAFSTTGNIEGVVAVNGGGLTDLSNQQLVDCDHYCVNFVCDSGCRGGLMENSLRYTVDAGGLEAETTYPYKAKDMKCVFEKSRVVASIKNYTFLPKNPNQIAHWVVNHAPIAIAADASSWQFYKEGIINKGCGGRMNHAILLVGYDVDPSGMPYWIIKNSWGTRWGLNGYLLVEKGNNRCGIENYPITALLE